MPSNLTRDEELCREIRQLSQQRKKMIEKIRKRAPVVIQNLKGSGVSFRQIAAQCDVSVAYVSLVANKKTHASEQFFCRIVSLEKKAR